MRSPFPPLDGIMAGLCLLFVLQASTPRLDAADGSKALPVLEEKLGADLVGKVDAMLTANGVKAPVFAFISHSGIEGDLGLAPKELYRILYNSMRNLKNADQTSKYGIISPALLNRRKNAAKITVETAETLPVLQKMLDPAGSQPSDALVYGQIEKNRKDGRKNLTLHISLCKIVRGQPAAVAASWDFNVESDAGDRRGLVFLGENFPPLFNLNQQTGRPQANPAPILQKVYIRVDGKRLPLFAGEASGPDSPGVIKLPRGSEYEIELFDGSGQTRTAEKKNRMLAAVLVDGLGVIGKWDNKEGPESERFVLCDNPQTAMKWVLTTEAASDTKDRETGKPGKSHYIRGWQTGAGMGRKFVFGSAKDSLAAATGQISDNMGIVTVVFFPEINPANTSLSRSVGGTSGTGMGQGFTNKVETTAVERYDTNPATVVNLRLVPDGADNPNDPLIQIAQ